MSDVVDDLTLEEVGLLDGLDGVRRRRARFDLALLDRFSPLPAGRLVEFESDGEDLTPEDLALLDGIDAPAPPDGDTSFGEGRKLRSYDLALPSTFAQAGVVTVITVAPECLYRIENVVATDSSSTAGYGTRVLSVAVGQRVQRPANDRGVLTFFFGTNAFINTKGSKVRGGYTQIGSTGILYDTVQRDLKISFTVSFVQACTFDATLFGSTVVEE